MPELFIVSKKIIIFANENEQLPLTK